MQNSVLHQGCRDRLPLASSGARVRVVPNESGKPPASGTSAPLEAGTHSCLSSGRSGGQFGWVNTFAGDCRLLGTERKMFQSDFWKVCK